MIFTDLKANYGRFLILGWIEEYKKQKPEETITILLFSTSKQTYDIHLENATNRNVKVEDYYTIELSENQNNIAEKLDSILSTNSKQQVVIIDCLSSLALVVGRSKTCRFVDKLKNKVNQLICLNCSEFHQENVPSIETLGDVYLRLTETSEGSLKNCIKYYADYTFRKPNGSVTKQCELVTQDLETYSITSNKKNVNEKRVVNEEKTPVPNVEATFRLEMNSRELEQKKNVDLPYVNSSKIIYNPDLMDDFDEEDPDDDLCI